MASDREIAGSQHKALEKANQQKDPFAAIKDEYGSYEKEDLKISIKFFSSKEMTKEQQKFCFKLTERNVAGYYKKCNLGWQPKFKQNDMAKKWAKFLIAYDGKKAVGFTMFRFDMDYGRSVVYCYELQIDEEYQRKGIGEHLMKCLERLTQIFGLELLVLTLLTNNPGAKKFYEGLGYIRDETSPDDEKDYEIMSKTFN